MSERRRIGPCMEAVAEYVAMHPGRPVLHAARHVGPHGSTRYGYQTVDRAIRAGLVRVEPNPKRKGSHVLYPVGGTNE
jgi:hypothetical protein